MLTSESKYMRIIDQLIVDCGVTKLPVGGAVWRAGESHHISAACMGAVNAARARVRPPLLAHKLLRFRRVSGLGRLVTL